MDSMWLEVILNVKAEEMDALCATLIANGVPGLAVEEEEEFRAFLEENRQYWDYVDDELMEQMKGVSRVKFYVTDDADGKKQLAGYLQDVDLPYTTVPLREYDWAHSWQKYYQPSGRGGEAVHCAGVGAGHRGDPCGCDAAACTESGPDVRDRFPCLHAALSGGRGGPHRSPMTWCWTWAAAAGSWPLPPCAWGRGSPPAVDIDPKAVDVAYENAALNGIGKDRCRFLAGNVLADQPLVNELAQEKADLVLANIVADVIIPLAARGAPACWRRTACSCAPASSTPAATRWRRPWKLPDCTSSAGEKRPAGSPWKPETEMSQANMSGKTANMTATAVVRPLVLDPDRRTMIISDIHGNLPFLKGLLRKVGYTKDDVLIILGDILEKSVHGLETLHYLMELSRTNTVYFVQGNCEDVTLSFLRGSWPDEVLSALRVHVGG